MQYLLCLSVFNEQHQGFPQRFPAKAAALTTQGCRLN